MTKWLWTERYNIQLIQHYSPELPEGNLNVDTRFFVDPGQIFKYSLVFFLFLVEAFTQEFIWVHKFTRLLFITSLSNPIWRRPIAAEELES